LQTDSSPFFDSGQDLSLQVLSEQVKQVEIVCDLKSFILFAVSLFNSWFIEHIGVLDTDRAKKLSTRMMLYFFIINLKF